MLVQNSPPLDSTPQPSVQNDSPRPRSCLPLPVEIFDKVQKLAIGDTLDTPRPSMGNLPAVCKQHRAWSLQTAVSIVARNMHQRIELARSNALARHGVAIRRPMDAPRSIAAASNYIAARARTPYPKQTNMQSDNSQTDAVGDQALHEGGGQARRKRLPDPLWPPQAAGFYGAPEALGSGLECTYGFLTLQAISQKSPATRLAAVEWAVRVVQQYFDIETHLAYTNRLPESLPFDAWPRTAVTPQEAARFLYQVGHPPPFSLLAWVKTEADLGNGSNAELAASMIRRSYLDGEVELDFEDYGLHTLPEALGHLRQIESLKLSSNNLTSIPLSLCTLPNLRRLDLEDNALQSLPNEIGNLSSLVHLNLDANRLLQLPDALGSLGNLVELSANQNALSALPETFVGLKRCQTVSLQVCAFSAFPGVLCKMPSLTYVDIEGNDVRSIPDEIINLTALVTLEMSRNSLTTLPECFGNLSSLAYLNVRHNQLVSLPTSLGDLSELQHIHLGENDLQSLPDGLLSLAQLETLAVENNKITTLSVPAGKAASMALVQLNISGNPLRVVPEVIKDMTALMVVKIADAKLESLPEFLGDLPNVIDVDVSRNTLQDLPSALSRSPSLQYLDLNFNRFTTIPPELCQSPNLLSLHLAGNPMIGLPTEMAQMHSLTALHLGPRADHFSAPVLDMMQGLEVVWERDTL
jgi:Leucine-rich repeat (LRR) protein